MRLVIIHTLRRDNCWLAGRAIGIETESHLYLKFFPLKGRMNLELAPLSTKWRVKSVNPDPSDEDRARHLEEIGFLRGEPVAVLARAFPGGDPMVVRIGLSTFALRRAEARCIEIEADTPSV